MMRQRDERDGRWRCALLLASALFAAGCRPDESPPVAGQALREGVDMVMYEMRTFVTREGIRHARIEADTAEFVGETEIHLRPLTMTFFAEDGSETTQVTADFGVYYELTEDMDAQGSVIALDRVDDQRLETERLRYVNADNRLYSETAFTMWSDGGRTVMRGTSFESDPGLDSVRVMTPSGRTEQPIGASIAPAPSGAGDAAGTPPPDAPPPVSSAVSAGPPTASADTSADARASGVPPDTSVAVPDTSSIAPDTSVTAPDTSGTRPPGIPRRVSGR